MRACVDPVRLFLFRVPGVIARKSEDRFTIELPHCPLSFPIAQFDIVSSAIAGAAQRSRPIHPVAPLPIGQDDEHDSRGYPVKACQRNERGSRTVQLNCANHLVLRTVLHAHLRTKLLIALASFRNPVQSIIGRVARILITIFTVCASIECLISDFEIPA
jgi:hypothetical protein